MQEQLYTGAVLDTKDKRDFKWSDIAGAVQFDWEKGFDIEEVLGKRLVVKDQGQSYSCGGQAWSYYGEVLSTLDDKKYDTKSAKFIYANTRVPSGGSAGRDNCAFVVKNGWADEALVTSYEDGKPPTEVFMARKDDITPASYDSAKANRALSYASTDITIESVATALSINNGCVVGVWGENNGTWRSEFPVSAIKNEWAHWVFVGKAKIINGKKYIGFINSWGKDVGNGGWQWIDETHFKNIFSAWTLVYHTVPEGFKHTFSKPLYYGVDDKDEVIALQTALKQLGFYKYPKITGNYYDITADAVVKFQLANGLIYPWQSFMYSGKRSNVGPKTRQLLNKLLNG